MQKGLPRNALYNMICSNGIYNGSNEMYDTGLIYTRRFLHPLTHLQGPKMTDFNVFLIEFCRFGPRKYVYVNGSKNLY